MVPAGTSIVFDMSLTYILVALAAVLLNNVLVERLSLHTRITAGTSASDLTPLGEKVGSGSGAGLPFRLQCSSGPVLSWPCSDFKTPLRDTLQKVFQVSLRC